MNRNLRKRKVTTPAVKESGGESSGISADSANSSSKAHEEVIVIEESNKKAEVTKEQSSDSKSRTADTEPPKKLKPNSDPKTKEKSPDVEEITEVTDKKEEDIEEVKEEVDPYASLSEADRTLLQTDVVEFLKRFTPRYFVPVYRTWSIPKSVAKQAT